MQHQNASCSVLHGLPRILGLSFLLLSCQGQPDTSSTPVVQPPTVLSDGLISTTQWEQKYAAAAAAQHLTPAFGVFYTDSTGQIYRSYTKYSDGSPESEAQAYMFDKCPALDSASYHDLDSSAYSADRNGVYYFCFSGHNQYFRVVPGADSVTFRALPGLEASYDHDHVLLRTRQLPALRPAGLRVYEGPANAPVPCGADDLYFTDSRVVVKDEALMMPTGQAFRPPAVYKKVYPVTR